MNYSTIRFILIAMLSLFLPENNLLAQNGDTSLVFEKFEKDDIVHFKPLKEQKVYAAGRIMEDQKNIPRGDAAIFLTLTSIPVCRSFGL